jgi:hypothetical protein
MIEPEALPAIAEDLARDNLTDAQIRGILGENWLRVAERGCGSRWSTLHLRTDLAGHGQKKSIPKC